LAFPWLTAGASEGMNKCACHAGLLAIYLLERVVAELFMPYRD
jgi:hypothetical protein